MICCRFRRSHPYRSWHCHPAQDYRFYHAGPLTRAHAETMAATADRPDSVVLVLVPAPRRRSRQIPGSIGG